MMNPTNVSAHDPPEERALQPTPEVQDPVVPMPGWWPDNPDGWQQYARQIAAEARSLSPRVVFLGDSITQAWATEGAAEWQARFAPLGAANLGIGGDRTQQVLWRIGKMGALEGLAPEAVVLKIGVNNLWRDVQQHGASRVAEGVARVVEAIRAACPGARVLVLGILPTQADPANPLRAILRDINARSAVGLPTADGAVRFADIGARFLALDGSISSEIMPDACHLSPRGYKIFADAVQPLLEGMLRR